MLNPRPTHEEFVQQYEAGRILGIAVKERILIKPDKCEDCDKIARIEGHHPDYSKPLKVRWLCRKCHSQYRRDKIVVV